MPANALVLNYCTSRLAAMAQHDPGPMATEQKHDSDARHERSMEDELAALLDRLPPMDREVLYLFEIAGFKTGEIGAMLGIRRSAVRQHLMRARQRFRALYSGEPGKTSKPETPYM